MISVQKQGRNNCSKTIQEEAIVLLKAFFLNFPLIAASGRSLPRMQLPIHTQVQTDLTFPFLFLKIPQSSSLSFLFFLHIWLWKNEPAVHVYLISWSKSVMCIIMCLIWLLCFLSLPSFTWGSSKVNLILLG